DSICHCLDCWRVEVKKQNRASTSLEAFASLEPSFDELQEIADAMARNYISNYQLWQMRNKSDSQMDQQYENALLLNKYVLLYEELSYAMNQGDISRVESCIIMWILIFKATGKHKYASQMTDFLCNVHFSYPEGLWCILRQSSQPELTSQYRNAVRYHLLINPTEQKGKFHAIDWCVELNNLFTKV
ncbi:hypothetical protein PAXRUDRAFT_178036, partial [Paxillus rubicundulus Ve08.2h10]